MHSLHLRDTETQKPHFEKSFTCRSPVIVNTPPAGRRFRENRRFDLVFGAKAPPAGGVFFELPRKTLPAGGVFLPRSGKALPAGGGVAGRVEEVIVPKGWWRGGKG